MLRSEILKDGTYTSLPLCVLKTKLLHPSSKLVLAALLNRLGNKDETYPSQKTLADDTALSIRSVKYAIAQLKATGLIDYEWLVNCVNRYTLNDPEQALNSATMNMPHHPDGAGNACTITPDGAGNACTTHSATLALLPPAGAGNACTLIVQRLPPEPTKLTNKGEPSSLTNKAEPTNSPQTPAAAGESDNHTPTLVQGAKQMKQSHTDLLTLWVQQKRPLPDRTKIKTFLKLLAIQEQKTGYDLDSALVLEMADPNTELHWLVKRQGDLYLWQLLQRRPETKALKAIKKARDKQGSAAQLEEIYASYPRHIGKGAALKAIKAAIKKLNQIDPNGDPATFLLERTKKFATSPAGQKGQYTPYPSTWFNQGRYADDEAEWGVTENRSGNLKREVTENEDEEPGETFQDFVDRKNKENQK